MVTFCQEWRKPLDKIIQTVKNICHINKILILICCMLILFPSTVFAKVETFKAVATYVLGDNDSKSDARRFAFLEAKRNLLEKIGTYIEAETRVINGRLSEDKIKSYSSALLSIETTNESWEKRGENMVLSLEVKTDVDKEKLLDEIRKIMSSSSAKGKIDQQQRQIESLEKQLRELQKQLERTDYDQSLKLRQERRAVFQKIDETSQMKIDIMSRISKENKNVIDLVELGMTAREVLSLAGQPSSSYQSLLGHQVYLYGTHKIFIENGIVGCIVKTNCENDWPGCSGYRMYNKVCIIK